MSQYLLSVHTAQPRQLEPMTPEQMNELMQRVVALEQEMDEVGAFLFGGRLAGPETASVVSASGGDVAVTGGPYLETEEHIGGFYIVEAGDLDSALGWAAKVVGAIGASIEVRPFVATGRAAEHAGERSEG